MAKSTRRSRLINFTPKKPTFNKTFIQEMNDEDQEEFKEITDDIIHGRIDSSNRTALAKELIREFDIKRKIGAVTKWLKEVLDEKDSETT